MLAAPRGLSQLHHVLHRLPTPRHPPEALISLTNSGNAGPGPWAEPAQIQDATSRFSFCNLDSTVKDPRAPRPVSARCAARPAQGAPNLYTPPPVGWRRHGESFEVEITGFEPVTPCVQSRCSTRLSYIPAARGAAHGSNPAAGPSAGGPRWIRTTDLSVISRVLWPTEL